MTQASDERVNGQTHQQADKLTSRHGQSRGQVLVLLFHSKVIFAYLGQALHDKLQSTEATTNKQSTNCILRASPSINTLTHPWGY
jgi:hypothetical protein